MSFVRSTLMLTHEAVFTMLQAAVAKAEEIGQPQCIVIVDVSCLTLAEFRMTDAKPLSLKSARAKAMTAASIGAATLIIPEAVKPLIAAATEGSVTGLPGGLPIRIDGHLLGGIGVGSGSGDQDITVAKAALDAIHAESDETVGS
ncbi:heme-binding protein [Actibacterium sp. 188UL27-1]|uniref:GlcG/HbpS family heme-binding protein n=1 Tax=Actibacterium sp. 188UL27-1 TaxID=2786961 RepID=UPI001958781F|nr:heme-binding protein [Actibacterium sp. 188UL27-1]MBM7069769.1 heme-binding protein [Actibacterium sp. 188UL27-1]